MAVPGSVFAFAVVHRPGHRLDLRHVQLAHDVQEIVPEVFESADEGIGVRLDADHTVEQPGEITDTAGAKIADVLFREPDATVAVERVGQKADQLFAMAGALSPRPSRA